MSSVEVRKADGLAIGEDQTFFNDVQKAALVSMGLGDAPQAEVEKFFHLAKRSGLDPFARQIYMIPRKSRNGVVWSVQVAIDGFRLIRDRKGTFRGMEEFWCGEDGVWRDVWVAPVPPVAAKVVLYVEGFVKPVSAVARFDEYAQRSFKGELSGMWGKMPALMVAKVAEALALRKAFPQDLAGLYTSDEMAQASPAQGAAAPAPVVQSVSAAPAVDPVAAPAEVVEDAVVVHDDAAASPFLMRAEAALAENSLDALRGVWEDAAAAGVLNVSFDTDQGDSTLSEFLLSCKQAIEERANG